MNPKVVEFISIAKNWQIEIERLRAIVHECQL